MMVFRGVKTRVYSLCLYIAHPPWAGNIPSMNTLSSLMARPQIRQRVLGLIADGFQFPFAMATSFLGSALSYREKGVSTMRAMVNRADYNFSFIERLATLRTPNLAEYGFEFLESLIKFLYVADTHGTVGDAVRSDAEHDEFHFCFFNVSLNFFNVSALCLFRVIRPCFGIYAPGCVDMANISHRAAYCAKYWFHYFISFLMCLDYKPDVGLLSRVNRELVYG
jgi:hypothetical protein